MKLIKFSPDPALAEVIRFYWFLEGRSDHLDFKRIMPFGALDIVIHRGIPMALGKEFDTSLEPSAFVEGQYLSYQFKKPHQDTSLVGISVHPWASEFLFDTPAIEFTGQLVSLDLINKSRYNQLLDIVQEPLNREEIVSRMNAYFLKELRKSPEINHEDLRMISKKIATEPELSFQQVSKSHWGSSLRSLQIKFKAIFGLTLSEFKQKHRFQRSVEIMNQREQSLTQVALESGFFDQAHFIRSFKQFSGILPSQYLSENANQQTSTMMGGLL